MYEEGCKQVLSECLDQYYWYGFQHEKYIESLKNNIETLSDIDIIGSYMQLSSYQLSADDEGEKNTAWVLQCD